MINVELLIFRCQKRTPLITGFLEIFVLETRYRNRYLESVRLLIFGLLLILKLFQPVSSRLLAKSSARAGWSGPRFRLLDACSDPFFRKRRSSKFGYQDGVERA